MKTFEHWDKVVSVTAKDIALEAVVDFETDDWKVYISERWRNLNNPWRIVLDKKYIVKKNKKVELTKAQLQSLIYEYYPRPVKVDDIWKQQVIWPGFIYRDSYDRDYKYLWKFGNEYIMWAKPGHGSNAITNDLLYVKISEEEINKDVVQMEEILNYIFWVANAEQEFDIRME